MTQIKVTRQIFGNTKEITNIYNGMLGLKEYLEISAQNNEINLKVLNQDEIDLAILNGNDFEAKEEDIPNFKTTDEFEKFMNARSEYKYFAETI